MQQQTQNIHEQTTPQQTGYPALVHLATTLAALFAILLVGGTFTFWSTLVGGVLLLVMYSTRPDLQTQGARRVDAAGYATVVLLFLGWPWQALHQEFLRLTSAISILGLDTTLSWPLFALVLWLAAFFFWLRLNHLARQR